MDVSLEDVLVQRDEFSLQANCKFVSDSTSAVIGPSGEGKSTLLLAIAGFVSLQRGKVLFGGKDCSTMRPADRPVTILFQEHNLFPHLSVMDNVALGLRTNLKLSRSDERMVLSVLERVGLECHHARMPRELSGGQRQRVALARALLRNRPVLLLDEPFAALGPGLRAEMLDLVREVREEHSITLIMVSHEPSDAKRIADLTVFVSKGTVSKAGETSALFDNPSPDLEAYLYPPRQRRDG